jgi:hypothetical protein
MSAEEEFVDKIVKKLNEEPMSLTQKRVMEMIDEKGLDKSKCIELLVAKNVIRVVHEKSTEAEDDDEFRAELY